METVTVNRVIASSPQALFDWISNAHNYTRVPIVFHEHVAIPGVDQRYGLGAVRVLVAAFGWFAERITAYDPPHRFDYHVYRCFPPARHEHGSVSFTATPAGTQVVWTSTFELRIPLVGPALTRWIGCPIFRYLFNRALDLAAADLA